MLLENGTEAGALYTKKQEINEPIRGMEAVPSEFSVVVKDRWGHLSESKEISLTPYYEEEVDKKKMGILGYWRIQRLSGTEC